jgi:hypothetical protein
MNRKKPDPELSVDLARLTTSEETLGRGLPGMGLAELAASAPLDMGLTVIHKPEPDNRAHCLVMGLATKEQCRELASQAKVRVPPHHSAV